MADAPGAAVYENNWQASNNWRPASYPPRSSADTFPDVRMNAPDPVHRTHAAGGRRDRTFSAISTRQTTEIDQIPPARHLRNLQIGPPRERVHWAPRAC